MVSLNKNEALPRGLFHKAANLLVSKVFRDIQGYSKINSNTTSREPVRPGQTKKTGGALAALLFL
jgi:hypothetical protein